MNKNLKKKCQFKVKIRIKDCVFLFVFKEKTKKFPPKKEGISIYIVKIAHLKNKNNWVYNE